MSAVGQGDRAQPRSKTLRRSLWILGVTFAGVIFAEQQAQPGHRAPGQLLQAASLGSRWFVHVVYGVLLAVLAALVAHAHFGRIRDGIKSLGIGCLVVAALMLICAGLLAQPMRSPHVSWPWDYWVHLATGAAVPLLIPAALFAFAWRFYEGPEDDSLQTWTFVAAITTTVIAVALFVFPPQILAGPTSMMTFAARRSHFIVLIVWCVAVIVRRQIRSEKETIPQPAGVECRDDQPAEHLEVNAESHEQQQSKEDRKERDTNDPAKLNWEVFAAKVEVLTLPLVLIGGVIALLEYSDAHKRDIREVSQRAYERADSDWTEFLKICAEHPTTNCYDGVEQIGSASEQGAVLSLAIDTFETAYRNYNDAEYANDATDNYCDEWPTWMVGMRKFARRPAFRETWQQIGNEYGGKFQKCMQATIDEQARSTPGDKAGLFAPLPKECQLDVCAFASSEHAR